ncbi:GPW/gp25 family protein [uncultured Rhodoblastus sp.]|uniref:GPW/gp25 family protein n=1 Tax=uncultured Rhodoblastus sp. TaxID=543037 RepID=UPI0025D3B19D|nr:GPW/gp25 family protein [uncultured Rhodoblastus sp.]
MDPVRFPLRIDGRGRTAVGSYEQHVEDLLEQLLFTTMGERVNRPDFGGGLLQMIFAPGGDELAAATKFLVEGAVQQWLGDVLLLESVDANQNDGRLTVRVAYRVRRTQERQQVTLERPLS